ncbi:MAG TPA: isocitrate lyase/PEP mutase family protein [Methylomirabilota bacterium]|nr:isocitrate lyase/PEP mutase family protein [Methylomirabilota bacterium]
MSQAGQRLRQMLQGADMVVAPFVFDAFQAKIAQAAGFEAVYMTGFGTAAARGFPDVGLLTMAEMVENVRYIANAVDIPLICDADTGYGNPVNVYRTVREYEAAGAAALHIEDQVWPKRCGFLAGKQVIPLAEMAPKVRAACDARKDMIIIARTDALAVTGWEDVKNRAYAYREAGADLIFVDGIRTLEDMKRYVQELSGLPLLYNGQLLSVQDTAKMGFKLMINSATLTVFYLRMRDAMRELKRTGAITHSTEPGAFGEITTLLGVPEALELGKKYGGEGEKT